MEDFPWIFWKIKEFMEKVNKDFYRRKDMKVYDEYTRCQDG